MFDKSWTFSLVQYLLIWLWTGGWVVMPHPGRLIKLGWKCFYCNKHSSLFFEKFYSIDLWQMFDDRKRRTLYWHVCRQCQVLVRSNLINIIYESIYNFWKYLNLTEARLLGINVTTQREPGWGKIPAWPY